MPIALVGTSSTPQNTAGTTLTGTVPAGVVDGHFLLWGVAGNNAAVQPAPTGWTIWHQGTTTALNLSIWYRFAASEPATYTYTSANTVKWSSMMLALSGVDTVTPKDLASAHTGGTTAVAFPANSVVTAGAWVIGWSAGISASGVAVSSGWASNNMTMDRSESTTGTGINAWGAVGHAERAAAGTFTPNTTFTGTTTRTLGVTSTVRPAATVVQGRVQRMSRRR